MSKKKISPYSPKRFSPVDNPKTFKTLKTLKGSRPRLTAGRPVIIEPIKEELTAQELLSSIGFLVYPDRDTGRRMQGQPSRATLALKLKPLIAARAKENLITHTGAGYQGLQKSAKAEKRMLTGKADPMQKSAQGTTCDELAKATAARRLSSLTGKAFVRNLTTF